MDKERCCGTCKWHKYEPIDDDWVCINEQSEYIADWTPYDHCCEEWEGDISENPKQGGVNIAEPSY